MGVIDFFLWMGTLREGLTANHNFVVYVLGNHAGPSWDQNSRTELRTANRTAEGAQ